MQVNEFQVDNILVGSEARTVIHSGIKLVADIVASTLGPKGRNVTYRGMDGRLITTKDGVTVAGWIDVKDPMLSVGADMIKSASKSALRDAGDGTTTATVLTEAMVAHLSPIAEEHSPVEVNAVLSESLEHIRDHILTKAVPIESVDDLTQVATVSANNNPEIGKMVGNAVWDAGESGKVRIVKTQQLKTTVRVDKGHTWDNGYLVNTCVTNPTKQTFDVSDALMLCAAGDVEDVSPTFCQAILDTVVNYKKSLVLLIQNFNDTAVNRVSLLNHTLAKNNIPHRIAVVRSAGHGNGRLAYMNDLLELAGKTLYHYNANEVQPIEESQLVSLETALIDGHQTSIRLSQATDEAIAEKINVLKQAAEEEVDHFDKSQLERRIAILSGVLVTILVGGISEEDTGDRNDLIDDAVRACQCARKQGILPGGGNVYRWIAEMLEDLAKSENTPSAVVSETLQGLASSILTPYRKIMLNAGYPEAKIQEKLTGLSGKGPECGYDVRTDTYHDDLVAAGIVDPTVVSISSLTAAISVTQNILMTDSIIIPKQYLI